SISLVQLPGTREGRFTQGGAHAPQGYGCLVAVGEATISIGRVDGRRNGFDHGAEGWAVRQTVEAAVLSCAGKAAGRGAFPLTCMTRGPFRSRGGPADG